MATYLAKLSLSQEARLLPRHVRGGHTDSPDLVGAVYKRNIWDRPMNYQQQAHCERIRQEKMRPGMLLISGPTGWLGSQVLLKALDLNYHVCAITRRTGKLFFQSHPNVKLIRAPLEDQSNFEKMQAAIERSCAGQKILFFNGLGAGIPPPGNLSRFFSFAFMFHLV